MTHIKLNCLKKNFDHLTECKKWRMFNWIFSDTRQYLGPFNLVKLCKTELIEMEAFYLLTLCKQMTDV